jgi:hypothetical protein
MRIELENGSVIETIYNKGENTRSKRGQEQLDNIKLTKQDRLDAYNMILGDDEDNFDKEILSQASFVGMDDYAKCTSKSEDMQINIGSILLVNKDGINEEYQVLDNSEINPEYPFALLDVKQHRIVQTSVSLDYMNYGHYIYIDKEYEIINIR